MRHFLFSALFASNWWEVVQTIIAGFVLLVLLSGIYTAAYAELAQHKQRNEHYGLPR